MKKSKRPLILSVNGKAELVQDAESYQHIREKLDRLEAVEAILVGFKAANEGRVKPARQVLEELGNKLGISR